MRARPRETENCACALQTPQSMALLLPSATSSNNQSHRYDRRFSLSTEVCSAADVVSCSYWNASRHATSSKRPTYLVQVLLGFVPCVTFCVILNLALPFPSPSCDIKENLPPRVATALGCSVGCKGMVTSQQQMVDSRWTRATVSLEKGS